MQGALEFIILWTRNASKASTGSRDGFPAGYTAHYADGDDINSWATDDTILLILLMYILLYLSPQTLEALLFAPSASNGLAQYTYCLSSDLQISMRKIVEHHPSSFDLLGDHATRIVKIFPKSPFVSAPNVQL